MHIFFIGSSFKSKNQNAKIKITNQNPKILHFGISF